MSEEVGPTFFGGCLCSVVLPRAAKRKHASLRGKKIAQSAGFLRLVLYATNHTQRNTEIAECVVMLERETD